MNVQGFFIPVLGLMVVMLLGECVLAIRVSDINGKKSEEESLSFGILECAVEDNIGTCLRTRLAREIDRIENQVSGDNKTEPPMSFVIEEVGSFIGDTINEEILGNQNDTTTGVQKDQGQRESRALEEARKKKFGKKKKRMLEKLYYIGMLLKAKISLILQLITTHLQFKFFIIGILSLIFTAGRFWLELKKVHQPAKVIYYEHAQHQHHYDHEDEVGGYWGRSIQDSPQNLAYNAYAPDK